MMFFSKIIFSNKALSRITRHLVFWLVYTTFFYLQSLTPEVVTVLYHSNAFYVAWVSVYCYLPACIFSVYVFLYFLLPAYLQKKKFMQFFIAAFLLYALFNLVNYFMAVLFFKKTCNCDIATLKPITVFGYGNNNAFLAIAIGCFAAGIKFVKEWYLQRKQVLEMENERIKTELQTLKTSIQPDFLFQSLKSLKKNMENGFPESAKMILQLSDVLSYLLYDCNAEFISLYQELSAVKQYILFEENKTGYHFFININLKEELKKFSVVPSVLLSFLQDCFINLNNNDEKQLRIHVECSIQTNELFFLFSVSEIKKMKLSCSFPDEIINNFKSRLEKFYASKYLLKTNFQDSLMEISLRLILSESAALNKAEQPEYEATV